MLAEEIEALAGQEEDHWWFRARRRILAVLVGPHVEAPSPRRAVDLGCGAGVDLARLPLGGALRVGVEPAAVRRDREHVPRGGRLPHAEPAEAGATPAGAAPAEGEGRVSIVRGRAERAPLLAGKFDLALALDVLEHLDDDAAALAEAARLLRPGGLLLVTVPAGPALWSEHDEALGHRRRYRREDLARAVAAAGFEIERLSHFNTLLFVPAAAYRWTRRLRQGRRDGGAGRAAPVSDTRRLGNAGGRLLEAIFASERWWLRRADLPFGLSLVCVARRSGGSASPGAA